ncbi:MAG: C39 family peptidase [Lachnospiraceae bacterium]|nr:C39 family peptidase [Lachnospiraceae bacterium]
MISRTLSVGLRQGYLRGANSNDGRLNEGYSRLGRKSRSRHNSGTGLAILVMVMLAALVFGAVRTIIGTKDVVYETVDIPKDILDFVDNNPEAEEYAKGYALYANADIDININDEIGESGIPLFIQWDKRWGYKSYGKNYIGVAGCGPTCIAMVACGLTRDDSINPYVVSNFADEQGYYTYGQGTSWSLMDVGAEQFGIAGISGIINEDYILENLSEESPMICSMKPGDFTSSGHFIVLAGIDSDGKIIVNDPNSPKNSEKHWDVDILVDQMKAIWVYSKL